MVEMIKLEDGMYVPRECCTITNPLTSGGKSEIDDVDLPCGADCDGACGECVIQKIFCEYAELTQQSESTADDLIKSQPESDGWILCSERLPEERESIFAKLKGTDKWKETMFEKISSVVIATVEFEDGGRKVETARTIDGKWKTDCFGSCKVIAWRPFLEPYRK